MEQTTVTVICVQETHCTFSEIESWQNLWKSSGGCESSWNCGVRASRGENNIYIDIYHLIPQCYDFSFVWNKQQ
jgi:hypothetical protein